MPDFAVAPLPTLSTAPAPRANAPAATENPDQGFSATLRQRIQAQSKAPENASNTKTKNPQQAEPATTPTPVSSTATDTLPAVPTPLQSGIAANLLGADKAKDDSLSATKTDDAAIAEPDSNALLQSLAALANAAPANVSANSGKPVNDGNGSRGRNSDERSAANTLSTLGQAANLASQTKVDSEKLAAADSATINATTAATTPFQTSLDAARQMQDAQSQISAPAQGGHPVSRSEAPVGSNAWNQEVADRVVWMAGQKESRADLVLNPPNLGRIEISVTVTGDQATASFVAANPNVRDALENALPRLREALNDVGIQLGQTSVGADTPQFASQQGETGHNPASGRWRNGADSGLARGAESGLPVTAARWQQQATSLVDAFA